MMEYSEIITKLLVTLIITYISIKFLAPLLQLLWSQFFNNPQKSNVDIDILIERQKQLLRHGLTKKESTSLKDKPHSNKTLAAYQAHFQTLTSNKIDKQDALNDIKKIFALFDSLQWGEGPPFSFINKKIEKEFDVSIVQFKITALLKKFIETDFLISRKGGALPSYQEIMSALELAAIVNKIFDESENSEYSLLEKLSLLWKISCSDIKKGFLFLLHTPKDEQAKIQKDILNNKITIDETYRHKVFQIIKSDDNKFFRSKKDFLNNLNSNANFFSILSPLDAPKDKNDVDAARKIFYANKKTPLEDIKKAYKQLVAARHPDKLPSHGISTEFEPIATKNFAIIQESYDIILKKHEND